MISANCKDILTFWHIMQVCASVCKSVWFYASLCKCERVSASQKICFRCIFCRSKKNLGLHDLVRNLSHQVGQVELVMSMARLNLVKIWFSQNTFLITFFTGRAFIMVKCILKLVFVFWFHLQNPRKQPKKVIFEKSKITVF